MNTANTHAPHDTSMRHTLYEELLGWQGYMYIHLHIRMLYLLLAENEKRVKNFIYGLVCKKKELG